LIKSSVGLESNVGLEKVRIDGTNKKPCQINLGMKINRGHFFAQTLGAFNSERKITAISQWSISFQSLFKVNYIYTDKEFICNDAEKNEVEIMSNLMTKVAFLSKIAQDDNAYEYFENEVEIDDAKALINEVDTKTAKIIKAFIKRYENDDDAEIEKPKAKTKKPKAKEKPERETVKYQPYHDNGGLGMLDYYADQAEFDFDSMVHVSSRYRVKRGSTNEVRAKYLNKLWHASIDLARQNDEQNWFTRIVRHQICAMIKGETERKKFLKGIPSPKDA